MEEKINNIVQMIIKNSRNIISVKLRFMNIALSNLPMEEYNGTIAVNGKQIFYNPYFLIKNHKETPRIILHMILHCVFQHMFISSRVDYRLWGLACDIAVENIINDLEIPEFETSRTQDINIIKNNVKYMTAEHIYRYLKTCNEREIVNFEFQFVVDDHSIWYEIDREDRAFGERQQGDGHDEENENSGDVEGQGESGLSVGSSGRGGSGGVGQGDNSKGMSYGNTSVGSGSENNSEEEDDNSDSTDEDGDKNNQNDNHNETNENTDNTNDRDEATQNYTSNTTNKSSEQNNNSDSLNNWADYNEEGESAETIRNNSDISGRDDSENNNTRRLGINNRNQTMEQWQSVAETLETDLETFSKEFGDQMGSLLYALKNVTREKYSYAEFLRKFATLSETMQINDDEFDYVFYTYGLELNGNMPLIEALEYKEVRKIRDFVIAIDTSGSVAGDLVYNFLNKTYNILLNQDSFFKKINLHIIQCDSAIQSVHKITDLDGIKTYMDNLVIRGYGGTDFRPVFEYVDKLVKQGEFVNLKGLLYFTDAIGTFPAVMPQYKTAVVYIKDYCDMKTIPSWAIRLELDIEELE